MQAPGGGGPRKQGSLVLRPERRLSVSPAGGTIQQIIGAAPALAGKMSARGLPKLQVGRNCRCLVRVWPGTFSPEE